MTALCFGQTGKITGHLIVTKKEDQKNIIQHGAAILNMEYKEFASIDKELNFVFDSLGTDTFEISISTVFYYQDTTIKKIVVVDGKTTHLEILYPPICTYDKNKGDKTCPVCNKQDQVIPIAYGLIVDTGKKSKKEEAEYFTAGCVVSGCDPHWYCKRDKKKF